MAHRHLVGGIVRVAVGKEMVRIEETVAHVLKHLEETVSIGFAEKRERCEGGILRSTLLQQWLKIDPLNRPTVYAQVYGGADFLSLNYWLGIVFSAGIATFGLIQDSPAVIIGAMLISPLMGPIMATGLGLAVGDLYLAFKAILNLVASVTVAVTLSACIVWFLPFHSATTEILSRTNPTLLDLGIALFSGLAGSVVVGRAGGDGLTALPGVAIAVALMPPLCSVGFGFGSGFNTQIISGAGLLFLTNLVAIISSAFAVFLLIGMNAEELAEQMEKSRESEFLAKRLTQGRARRVFTHNGNLGWRILVLVILLGAIAIPLKTAFVQLTEEAAARSTVQRVVKDLLPPGALVSQQVDVGRHNIAVHLFSTQEVSEGQQKKAQEEIQKRSGRPTQLSVSSVASQSELAEMMDRLTVAPAPTPPVPIPPPPPSLDSVRAGLLQRVTPVLSAIWPAEAPLSSFNIALSAEGFTLDAEYQSKHDLTPIALELITKELQEQLKLPKITVHAHRVPIPHEIVRSPTPTGR
jgi:uncharacterized hydrophobic protein (TIGR00271 family)